MPNLQGRQYADGDIDVIINVTSRNGRLDYPDIHSVFLAASVSVNMNLEFPPTRATAIPRSAPGLYRVRALRLRDQNTWIPLYNGVYGSNRSTLTFDFDVDDVSYRGTICELRLPNRTFLRREVYRRLIRPNEAGDVPFQGIFFAHYYLANLSICHGLFLRLYPLYPLLLV